MRIPFARRETALGKAAKRTGTSGMVKTMMTIALLAGASVSAVAAQAPDCIPGSLADYGKLSPQGCAIGNKTFSNFSYHQASDGLPAEAISVTPGTVPGKDEPALLFEAKWTAPSSSGSFVAYTVAVALEEPPINGASLEMQFGQITGSGEAHVFAELCPVASGPNTCGTGELKLRVALSPGQPKRPTDSGALKVPLRQVRVITPVSVTAGKNGSASLNGFMMVFHSVEVHPSQAVQAYRQMGQ